MHKHRTQRVGETRNGKKLVGYNVYYAADGCGEVYLGFARNIKAARAMVGNGGLPESEYGTARVAGHCGGMQAPDKSGEGEEAWEWFGEDGFTCAMPVFAKGDE